MEYTFDDLKKDLSIGHEIEFYYLEDRYSISNSKNGWFLIRFGDENYQAFNNQFELLDNATIESMKLIDIWDKVKVDIIF